MNPTLPSLLVITNANAGTNEAAVLDPIVDRWREQTEVEVAATGSPDELADVLEDVDGRRVVVAGGDGSLHAVVKALVVGDLLDDAEVALLPLGTGNDFARGVGIPLECDEAAGLVLNGTARPADVITDDADGIVINNVHVGASAQASRYGARWKERLGRYGLGKLGYPIGAALASVRPPYIRLDVLVDGQRIVSRRRPILMLSVGNSSHVGGGTPITPEATPEDGKADVMISFATGPLARFGYVLRMRKGEHQERDDVLRVRGRVVWIKGSKFWCSADGEITGPHRSRRWVVHQGALQMVLPK